MPVAFFAYPAKPSKLWPEDCQVHVLVRPDEDQIAALEMLCEAVGARQTAPPVVNGERPMPASGAITSEALGASFGALLPENAIVADEALTTGRGFFAPTKAAAPHDWLFKNGRLDRSRAAARDRRRCRLPRP
jgi:acetolactate synthase I/II/III large subunit